jgi:Tfp pilus assembly protein PilF
MSARLLSATRRSVRRTASKGAVVAAVVVAAATFLAPAIAAPFRPAGDAIVLERVSPVAAALREFRATAGAIVKLADALNSARHYVELGQRYADPRAYGYAQAALGSWWTAAPAPAPLLVMRARILQFRHDFDGALSQLEAALERDQFDPDAWLLFANIEEVRGNVRAARAACLKLIPLADPLVGATCAASAAALGGRAAQGELLLAGALAQPTGASVAEKAWAWTMLAEMRARLGRAGPAEAAFRQALLLQADNVYSRAAYADFLLDENRAGDVRVLLGIDPSQADATLLRAAIAARRGGDPDARELADALARRFTEARTRGDTTHLREQARFALEIGNDAHQALELAQRNFAVQREFADVRVLIESAAAAGEPQAAQPALDWLRATGNDSPTPRLPIRTARLGDGP